MVLGPEDRHEISTLIHEGEPDSTQLHKYTTQFQTVIKSMTESTQGDMGEQWGKELRG